MSGRPLLTKGNLRQTDDSTAQDELDTWVPIDYILDWIKRHEQPGPQNRVLVVKAETASGKSTIIPPAVFRQFTLQGIHNGVICTQPRILTAIENVNKIAQYNKEVKIGQTAGWNTGVNKVLPVGSKTLISATVGVLLMQLNAMTDQEFMNKYSFVMIDEVHERNIETDMCIMLLKKFLVRNAKQRACPYVILMSATLDEQPILDYFGLHRANFIWCASQTVGHNEHWDWCEIQGSDGLPKTTHDYLASAIVCIKNIMTDWGTQDPVGKRDIIVFLPSMTEITKLAQLAQKLNGDLHRAGHPVMSVLKIDGGTVAQQTTDYKKVMRWSLEKQPVLLNGDTVVPSRRLILATNVAETGLSLDELKYVIDSGFSRESEYHPVYNVYAVVNKVEAQPNSKQRKGRAGRYFKGEYYPLFPQYIWQKMPLEATPKMLCEDITRALPTIIHQSAFMDLLSLPSADAYAAALSRLFLLGFITPGEPQAPKIALTKLGELCRRINLPVETTRMILAAATWNINILDMISIAAFVEAPGSKSCAVFYAADPKRAVCWQKVYALGMPDNVNTLRAFVLLMDEWIDGLILITAVSNLIRDKPVWSVSSVLSAWCNEANLNYASVMSCLLARENIIQDMLASDIDVMKTQVGFADLNQSNFMDYMRGIKHCIYDGYRCNVLTRKQQTWTTDKSLQVTIGKFLARSTHPEIVQAADVVTSQPTTVLYKRLDVKLDAKTNKYRVVGGILSMMDGWCAVSDLA